MKVSLLILAVVSFALNSQCRCADVVQLAEGKATKLESLVISSVAVPKTPMIIAPDSRLEVYHKLPNWPLISIVTQQGSRKIAFKDWLALFTPAGQAENDDDVVREFFLKPNRGISDNVAQVFFSFISGTLDGKEFQAAQTTPYEFSRAFKPEEEGVALREIIKAYRENPTPFRRPLVIVRLHENWKIATEYEHSELGELMRVTDPEKLDAAVRVLEKTVGHTGLRK